MSGRAPERIDQVSGAPVVGRTYLVPTVFALYYGTRENWPVIGPKHTDPEHFRFATRHYHLDRRFLDGQRHRRLLKRSWTGTTPSEISPLIALAGEGELPPPVLRPLRCRRATIGFPYKHQPAVRSLAGAFAGTRCARGRAGLICPHRHVPLGSIVAVDGVITCPLHGLRIDAETGIVLPAEPSLSPSEAA